MKRHVVITLILPGRGDDIFPVVRKTVQTARSASTAIRLSHSGRASRQVVFITAF
jgi:hypothetical protein